MFKINEIQLDALREIINIGIGYSAGSLNKMLQQHIVMTVPELHLIDANDPSSFAKNTYSSRLSGIFQSFDGAYSANNSTSSTVPYLQATWNAVLPE